MRTSSGWNPSATSRFKQPHHASSHGQFTPPSTARMETQHKRSTTASGSRKPLPLGCGFSRCWRLKILCTVWCKQTPSFFRKCRRRYPGQPTTTAMGTAKPACGGESGFETLRLAPRTKWTVLHGNSPPTRSLRREAGKEMILGARLRRHPRGPTLRHLQYTKANAPSPPKPGKYEAQELSAESSSKTPAFKPHVLWQPSSVAASPRLSFKKQDYASVIDSGHIVSRLPNEDIKGREGMQRQYKLHYAGTRSRGRTPSSSLPWGHDQHLHSVCIRHRFTCIRAYEPSFRTVELSTAQLAACRLDRKLQHRYAFL